MKKTIILNNGIEMPLIGLGTAGMKGEDCIRAVKEAIEIGYPLIDTAQMYENEEEVGKAIRESGISRSDLFLTTKIYRITNTYESAKQAIDISLERLGTTYVDLLLLHEPYVQGPEMYRAMEEAYKEGKARAIGISNYDEKWYPEFLEQCTVVPMVNQLECHIYYQKNELQQMMEKHGTKMQAWSPFAQGKANVTSHPLLTEIGSHYGKSAAQVALRFLMQRGISVIPKSSHKERLIQNLDVFDFELSAQEMELIKALDEGKTFFPWTKEF